MTKIGETIKRLRESKSLTQNDLARLAKVSQPTIADIESGKQQTSKKLPAIAKALGVTVAEIDKDFFVEWGGVDQTNDQSQTKLHSQPIENIITKVDTPLGARDLPVFAAVEGGDGDLVVSTEPVDLVPRPWYLGEVKDGFGVIVTGESMYPAYEPGDTAIVNPRLPYMRGKIHIFTAESENSHFKATIKKLVGVTQTHWKVEQFNPPHVFELDRKIWTNARRVVGKYNG